MEELKSYKKTMILTSIVTLLPILIGVLLWDQLPEQIATHFDFEGTPNGWMSKGFTVFGIPLFLLACQWMGAMVTLQDPKHKNVSEKMFKVILWIVPACSFILGIVTYGYELGYQTSHSSFAMVLIGILFLIVGNYLPKCKQNYTTGIKLPWTLHDEENWNHTHRMAGFLWMAGGGVMILNAFLQWDWLFFVVIVTTVLVPTIYSFLYYKKHNAS